MRITDFYDINKILIDAEQVLCIDGSDYNEKSVDNIYENILNRIIRQYQLDLHGKTVSDADLYIGRTRSSIVLFMENISEVHARLSGYNQACVRYNSNVTIKLMNVSYMGYTKESFLSFLMAIQKNSTIESARTAVNALSLKFGSINNCIEKKAMLLLLISYKLGLYEFAATIGEILYLGMKL